MKTAIKNNLRNLRQKAKLTQKELALKLDFNDSQDRICHWEKGLAIPSVPNLFKLCRLYQVKPDEIYPEL